MARSLVAYKSKIYPWRVCLAVLNLTGSQKLSECVAEKMAGSVGPIARTRWICIRCAIYLIPWLCSTCRVWHSLCELDVRYLLVLAQPQRCGLCKYFIYYPSIHPSIHGYAGSVFSAGTWKRLFNPVPRYIAE